MGSIQYHHELAGDTLTIQVQTKCWTIDLLSQWLDEIFVQYMLAEVERIRYIEIKESDDAN